MEAGLGAEPGYARSVQHFYFRHSFDPRYGTPTQPGSVGGHTDNLVGRDLTDRDEDGRFIHDDSTHLERERTKIEIAHPQPLEPAWQEAGIDFPKSRATATAPDQYGRDKYVNQPARVEVCYAVNHEGDDIIEITASCGHDGCTKFAVVDRVGQKATDSDHVKLCFVCARGVVIQFCSCISTVDGFQNGSQNECTLGTVTAHPRYGFFPKRYYGAALYAFKILEHFGAAPMGVPPKDEEPDPYANNPCRGIILGYPTTASLEPSDLVQFVAEHEQKQVAAAEAASAKEAEEGGPILKLADIVTQHAIAADLRLTTPASDAASEATTETVDCDVQGNTPATHPATSSVGCFW